MYHYNELGSSLASSGWQVNIHHLAGIAAIGYIEVCLSRNSVITRRRGFFLAGCEDQYTKKKEAVFHHEGFPAIYNNQAEPPVKKIIGFYILAL
jgi:hypothetical protein